MRKDIESTGFVWECEVKTTTANDSYAKIAEDFVTAMIQSIINGKNGNNNENLKFAQNASKTKSKSTLQSKNDEKSDTLDTLESESDDNFTKWYATITGRRGIRRINT